MVSESPEDGGPKQRRKAPSPGLLYGWVTSPPGVAPNLLSRASPGRRVVLTYWSGGTIEAVHRQKDPGGIPIAVAEAGSPSVALVRSSRIPALSGVEIVEVLKEGPGSIRGELRCALSVLDRYAVTDVIVIKGWKRQMLVTLWDRLIRGVRSVGPSGHDARRWILKMDWGGPYSDRLTKYFTGPYLFLSSWLFDKIVVETTCAEEIARRWVWGPARLCMIPDGYSPHHHPIAEKDPHPRSPQVLSVARISRVKRLEVLIRAFGIVSNTFPGWTLRLVGPVEDFGYRQELEALVDSLGLRSRVQIVGEVTNVSEEYQRASIFCSTSQMESFGISRVEALVHGLPVITSPSGCPQDLRALGMIVLEKDDEAELAHELHRLIADEALRHRLADQARGRIPTWNQVVEDLLRPVPPRRLK